MSIISTTRDGGYLYVVFHGHLINAVEYTVQYQTVGEYCCVTGLPVLAVTA